MVIRESLKAGVLSYIDGTERVNGSVKSKVFGQGVGSGSRAWMGRVGMGEGSAEKLRGERVGALGRVRGFGGVRVGEGGVDGEFRGDWRGECWGESWVCWSWVGEG